MMLRTKSFMTVRPLCRMPSWLRQAGRCHSIQTTDLTLKEQFNHLLTSPVSVLHVTIYICLSSHS